MKKIFEKKIDLDYNPKRACIHCGYGEMIYRFYRDDDDLVFTDEFRCLTYDGETTLWRGSNTDIEKLIEVIDEHDYIPDEEKKILTDQVKLFKLS